MLRFEIFQCIPAYKPLVASRLINRLKKTGCRILLDLEDSIMDVDSPECTSVFKKEARKAAVIICEQCTDLKPDLRINSPANPEFLNDIEVLRHLKNRLNSVFIPKVASAEDIEQMVSAFGPGPGGLPKLSPVIETKAGIRNIKRILSGRMKKHIGYVFFGNYDYHLDADIFPIVEQNSEAYWTFIKPLIGMIENENLDFGNSPYAGIGDFYSLQTIVSRLSGICNRRFALMSLHYRQTEVYDKLREGKPVSPPNINKDRPPSDPRSVLDAFRRNRQKKRSFSINEDSLSIITPQEYLLAKRRIEHANN